MREGSPRSFLKLAGPTGFENDRIDHPVSSETPVEIRAEKLEHEGSPRPILKLIGPIIFFAVRGVGGREVPGFFGGRGTDHDDGWGGLSADYMGPAKD